MREEQREGEMTLRDAMTLWGEKNNVEVRQVEGRTLDGKKLYVFGLLQYYIDDNVAFVKVDGEKVRWEPMSMQEMLERNRQMMDDPVDSSVC